MSTSLDFGMSPTSQQNRDERQNLAFNYVQLIGKQFQQQQQQQHQQEHCTALFDLQFSALYNHRSLIPQLRFKLSTYDKFGLLINLSYLAWRQFLTKCDLDLVEVQLRTYVGG